MSFLAVAGKETSFPAERMDLMTAATGGFGPVLAPAVANGQSRFLAMGSHRKIGTVKWSAR